MKKSIKIIISIFIYILILFIENTVVATEIKTSSGKTEIKIGETIELESTIQSRIEKENGYINNNITDWTTSSQGIIEFTTDTKEKTKVTIKGLHARRSYNYIKISNK